MNDRELLELAAKAAGIEYCWVVRFAPKSNPIEKLHITKDGETVEWNPLTDDGDALRLAVKLELLVHIETCYYAHAMKDNIYATEHIGNDGKGCIYESTRRAIVRAAAEVGRIMK